MSKKSFSRSDLCAFVVNNHKRVKPNDEEP